MYLCCVLAVNPKCILKTNKCYKMKILLLSLSLALFTLNVNAQDLKLAIGKTTVDGDALIDFNDVVGGMVIAPIEDVTTSPSSAGTIAFDGNTGSFRFFDGTSWSAVVPGGATGGVASGTDTYKNIIGAITSSTTGVVIMGEDVGETQALVLPKHDNGNLKFNNPVPGLMYYDTVLKSVMVYNGVSWTSF